MRNVAFGISTQGSEDASIRVAETTTGEESNEVISQNKTASQMARKTIGIRTGALTPKNCVVGLETRNSRSFGNSARAKRRSSPSAQSPPISATQTKSTHATPTKGNRLSSFL